MITACSGGGGGGASGAGANLKYNVNLVINQAILTEGLLLQNTASGADNTPFAMPKSEAKTLDLSAKIPKGTDYDIKVMRQPEGFSQHCYVEQGKGSYNGGKIAIALSCIKGFAKVTTYAGKAKKYGRANGALKVARFNRPEHMVFDSKGNLFVADFDNLQIRKITPEGQVSLFAGNASGASGTNDGTGSAAKFNLLSEMTIDKDDNLYVGGYNNCVRKITPEAKVTTLAGQCGASVGNVPDKNDFSAIETGADARFGIIFGMVYDGDNALYVFDTNNEIIRKISINKGTAATAKVQNVIDVGSGDVSMGLSADKKSLYYIPKSDCKLHQMDLTSTDITKVTSKAGCGFKDGDFKDEAQFDSSSNQIIASKSGQFLYLPDFSNQRIRRIDLINKKVTTLAGKGTEAVTDGTGDKAEFRYPKGIAQDAQGNLFVSSWGNVIRKIDNVTEYQLKLSITGLNGAKGLVLQNNGSDDLANPTDIGFGQMKLGEAYKVSIKHQPKLGFKRICEVKNGTGTISKADATVDIVCSDGAIKVSTYAGKADKYDKTNGALSSARFNNPEFMVFDSKGNLFIADYSNNQIRKITSGGQVSLFAGDENGASGIVDDTGSAAKFNNPKAITIDKADNLYVGGYNNCVRKITPEAKVTTLAGQCGASVGNVPDKNDFLTMETGDNARLGYINSIVYDGNGTLYVSDAHNELIRKISINDGTSASAKVKNIIATDSYRISMGLSADKNSLYYISKSDGKLHQVNLGLKTRTALTTAGTGFVDGNFSEAKFKTSNNQIIASKSGQFLFLADKLNHRIRQIDLINKNVSTLAGSGTDAVTDGIGTNASFGEVTGIAKDAQDNLFVSSYGHVIRKLELVKQP